ncbi:MAG: VWA domain-containing protein [Acidobacteria bacterium]|nr:VWA domain-containing protein [Acidobacteriota bacterium]
MSFLFPAFLLGAITIAIPVLLHLVRRERGPIVPFSAVRFVRRSPAVRTRRPRLRELLLLALRVTALLLLTLAFARPFVADTMPERPITVVAIDRSLSMSAPGQMEEARRLAAAAVAGAPADHRVAVVAFDDRATVVLDASVDRAGAVSAVESVVPTAGTTRYAAALSAASGVLGARNGRVVVVSDLQRAGWSDGGAPVAPRTASVEVAAVDPVAANLAVTAAARTPDGLSAVVGNAGPAARDALVVLALDEAVLESRVVTLEPGANAVRFDAALPEAGVASVQVVDPEGYAGDDRRHVLLDPLPATRVLVVANGGRGGSDAYFVDRALAAGADDAPFVARVTAPAAVSSLDPGAWEAIAAVLILGTDGLEREGRERLAAFVAAGGGLLVAAGPGVEPALLAGILGPHARIEFEPAPGEEVRRWVPADRRHPVLRALGQAAATALGEVVFRDAAAIGEGAPEDQERGDPAASAARGASATRGARTRTLGRFDDGTAALVEYDLDAGRALLFASDLNGAGNDFPQRPGFAPFIVETVRYVARLPGAAREVTVADVPPGVPAVPGVAVVPESGRRIVVNVDPRESDPAPMTAEAFLGRVDSRSAVGGATDDETGPVRREREQAYWWYALAAMLAVLVGEAWLARTMA